MRSSLSRIPSLNVLRQVAPIAAARTGQQLERLMYVNVAVLKETHPHERRVALVPSVAAKLSSWARSCICNQAREMRSA